MAITAQMVKNLREMTGAGMMDCKKALVAVDGDMDKAVDWLRQKGMAKAASKSNRATAEGLVRVATNADGTVVALGSLYCETDFVARGEKFQELATAIATEVLNKNPSNLELLENAVGDEVKQMIATVGENMKIGKFARIQKESDHDIIGNYVHANGKIGTLVLLEVGKSENTAKEEVKNLAKELAMQIAAANPLALDAAGLDPEVVKREYEVYRQKALADGKPEKIVEKIAEGAVKKFEKTVCLLEQPYIRDDKKSVNDLIHETAKAVGDTIKVKGYSRIQLTAEEEN